MDETIQTVAAQEAGTSASTLERGVKLLGDTMVAPGTSLLLDGEVRQGFLHVVAGVAARVALGHVGWLLVAANAYSRSVSGKGIVDHVLPGGRKG